MELLLSQFPNPGTGHPEIIDPADNPDNNNKWHSEQSFHSPVGST
jgi:hypothetical protein